jgi:GNAT superfamily N-acetyltransferase
MAEVSFRRTHDAALIERTLRRDAFDAPIPYLTPGLLRVAVRSLLAPSPDVYFVVAEVDGAYAGFVLAHTLGPRFWRRFAREQLAAHPIAMARTVVSLKFRPLLAELRRLRPKSSTPTGGATPPSPTVGLPDGIVTLDRPFGWSDPRPDIGQLDQFFVVPDYRGRGVAAGLLRTTTAEMERSQVSMVEAHVDADNVPSLRAFIRAGWTAYRMAGGDFYVCYESASGRAPTAG